MKPEYCSQPEISACIVCGISNGLETDCHGNGIAGEVPVYVTNLQDDIEKMAAFMMEVLDRVTLHCSAVGFIADKVQDEQASANLHHIEQALERTAYLLSKHLGREDDQLAAYGPY